MHYTTEPPPNLTYEQYLALIAALVARANGAITGIALPYRSPSLTNREWLRFLAAAYPLIEDARAKAAELAREFYDAERARYLDVEKIARDFELDDIRGPDGRPALVTNDTSLFRRVYERADIGIPNYEPNWFQEQMQDARPALTKKDSTPADIGKVLSFTQKAIENATRHTTLEGVKNDGRVLGWARVEGNENVGSCAFCAMLISRGPVYKDSPEDAGLAVSSNARGLELFEKNNGDIPLEMMTRWHPNCDCKVVPVFKDQDWKGREQFEAMQKLWGDVTSDFDGWDKFKAFRRELEKGNYPAEILRPRIAA